MHCINVTKCHDDIRHVSIILLSCFSFWYFLNNFLVNDAMHISAEVLTFLLFHPNSCALECCGVYKGRWWEFLKKKITITSHCIWILSIHMVWKAHLHLSCILKLEIHIYNNIIYLFIILAFNAAKYMYCL